MNPLRSAIRFPVVGWMLLAGWACDGLTEPDTGTLDVSVNGFPPGYQWPAAGLTLVIEGQSHRFITYQPGPRLVIPGLPAGELSVTLDGLPVDVPADCQAVDGTQRTTTIQAGGRAYLWFSLECTWGRLRISTTTTGFDPDADGYTVEFTGFCGYYSYYGYESECQIATVPMPSTGTVVATVATDMFPHRYTATISGISANCTTTPTHTFDYPAQTEIAFDVTCSGASGGRSGAP